MTRTQDVKEYSAESSLRQPPAADMQVFSRVQVAAVLVIGAICSVAGPLQPLLLGTMLAQGRLTAQEMGQSAMLEALGMALSVTILGAVGRPKRLKLIIFLSSLASLTANITTIYSSHEAIQIARLVNGISAGVMLWIWTGMLTRVALPARLVAIFVTVQSVFMLALSAALSSVVTPRWGASGGYACLAVISVLTGLLSCLAPSAYKSFGSGDRTVLQYPNSRGTFALLAVILHMAGVMAIWVYVMPLGRQQGLSETFVANAISASLAAQIVGGVAATILARKKGRNVLLGCIAASVAALGCLGPVVAGPASFVAGLVVISFCLMFGASFHMPFLIDVDPSRRAGIFMVSAQFAGFSSGPAIASLFVTGHDVSSVLVISAALFASAALLMFCMTTIWRGRDESSERHHR